MTQLNRKLTVLTIAVLVVSSVFAGSIVFTTTAGALFTGPVSADGATDVQAFRTAATQTITATVTVTNGSTGNTLTVDIPNGNLVQANAVSVDNADVSTAGFSLASPTRVVVDLTDTNPGDDADEPVEVTLTVTHNLANVGPASNLPVRVSAGGLTETTRFDVVRYVGPAGPVGRVFLGDRGVDLTNIRNAPQSGGASLFGVAGDAEGGIADVSDVRAADITASNGFETGSYSFTSSSSSGSLSVVEPRITDVTLYRGVGTDGADITGGSIPASIDTVTVEVEFNFAEAEDVVVTVEDEPGLDVTRQLTSSARISNSGGTVVLRNLDDLEPGRYEIIAEGADDLDDVSARAVIGLRAEVQGISLDESSVTKGEVVVVTVVGTPGDFGLVRIEAGDLDGVSATDANAAQVFRATSDVETRRGTNTLGGTSDAAVGAVVDLGDDGEARVGLDTAFLETTTVDVEFVELDAPNTNAATLRAGFDARADATAELTVGAREVVITGAPRAVSIGDEFTITGVAPESDDVKAYARIDDEWVPLRDGDGDLTEDRVDSRGRFSLEVGSSRVVNLPDSYRIAVVADPVAGGVDYLGSSRAISTSTYGDFETKATTTLRTAEGELTSALSSTTIAANVGDEVVLSGASFGQGDSVRVYVVGPRGQYLTADGAFGAETVDVDENAFEETYDAFQQRGTYTFIVVGRGRDAAYSSNIGFGGPALRRGLTPQQAVEIVRDAYTGPGIDDRVVELRLVAANPSLSIEDRTTNGQLVRGEVTVSGTSNRQDETPIFVEVLDERGDVVASAEAEVDGRSNRWATTVDLSELAPGVYTVRASDGEVSASRTFELVDELTTVTPTETPVETPSETPTDTATPTATPTDTATSTDTPTDTETTATSTPGFGVVVALVALAVAALLARRRG